MDTSEAANDLSKVEYQMTIADLKVAGEALRTEPYGRLPMLAGSLSMAAFRFEKLQAELAALKAKHAELVEVVMDFTTTARMCERNGDVSVAIQVIDALRALAESEGEG